MHKFNGQRFEPLQSTFLNHKSYNSTKLPFSTELMDRRYNSR